jgi:hypothetical protein
MNPESLALMAQIMSMLMSAAASLPGVISAAETAIDLLNSNTDPTEAQEREIRAALDAANDELQRA